MTGLDQEALVKLAIAGAFDATSENQDNNGNHDAAIVTQSVGDDQSAMHQAEGNFFYCTKTTRPQRDCIFCNETRLPPVNITRK